MKMSEPKNQTVYTVHQYGLNGSERIWETFDNAEELKAFVPNIINSGSDCRIEKTVTRTTDVTDQYLK